MNCRASTKRAFLSICLALFLAALPAVCSDSNDYFREDVNRDGRVDVRDVLSFLLALRQGATAGLVDYDTDGEAGEQDALALMAAICGGERTPAGMLPLQPGEGMIEGPLVWTDRWPRAFGLTSWVEDVLRLDGTAGESETMQGISFYNWLRLFSRDCNGGMAQAWEGNAGEEQYVTDAHKNLFVYGWGYCDTHSRIAEAAWREWTGDSTAAYRVCVRNPGGGYHTMFRLRLDGSYGAFDALFGYYLLEKDSPGARVLDWAEVGVDSNIVRNEGFENRCEVFFVWPEWYKGVVSGYEPVYWDRESEWSAAGRPVQQVFSSPMHRMGTQYHSMNWKLPRGSTVRRYWGSDGESWYMPVAQQSQFLPSGRFYELTEECMDGHWQSDPGYARAVPYLSEVPLDEGYPDWMRGGRTIGQAWGSWSWNPEQGAGEIADAVISRSGMVRSEDGPCLLPAAPRQQAQAVFEFTCPYVLVSGVITGELAAAGDSDRVSLELRTLEPKQRHAGQADRWSQWREIASGPGDFELRTGRSDYVQGEVSLHGKYRFQLRLSARAGEDIRTVGLERLGFELRFENAIMSLPRLEPGRNRISIDLAEGCAPLGPVRVSYEYEEGDSMRVFSRALEPREFAVGQASFEADLPGLSRCLGYELSY